MTQSESRILWILARTESTVVGEGEQRMLSAAKGLQEEGIVTLTDRGDGTFLVRLIRDSQ